MKKFPKLLLLAFALTILSPLFVSCDSNDKSCQETVCTLEFVILNIAITDQDQNPLILDNYQLINLEDNSTITLSISGAELDSFIQNGRYPIMDDAGLENNERINIQFKGFLNGQEVVTENYTVASDCCHVFLVSGNTEIVL